MIESRVSKILAECAFEMYVLAQAAQRFPDALVDGRVWERVVGESVRRPGLDKYTQAAGITTLFNYSSASGAEHELDAVAAGSRDAVILECKSQATGPTKADAALFHEKVMDFYCERAEAVAGERWQRLMVSSTPVSEPVRRFCVHLGIILCDPGLLPLPVVVWVASQPSADRRLQEPLLQESVRMGEPALSSMQERWMYDPAAQEIRFRPRILTAGEIDELLWLQGELGQDILELYEHARPGWLAMRTMKAHNKLVKLS